MDDVKRVQNFREAVRRGDTDVAQGIVHEFWAAFGIWIFGSYPAGDQPKGVLGGILRYEVGPQRAAELWVPTVTRFEELVFSVEELDRCAAAFDPAKGGFAGFFKRWLTWKAHQVAAEISAEHGNRPKPIQGMDVDDILVEQDPKEQNPFWGIPTGLQTPPEYFRDSLRRWLELYCQRGGEPKATAAWELKYRAYWPVEQMTQATRTLLAQTLSAKQWKNLSEEYGKCQQEVRQYYSELNIAFRNFQTAQEDLYQIRKTYLNEGIDPRELDQWEEEASQHTKEELEETLRNLPPEERLGWEGRKWQYQIAWKTWSLARGKRNRWRVKVQGYEACRIPWIRSQEEIGRLLGISQPTVFRYQQSVQQFLRDQWKPFQKPCDGE